MKRLASPDPARISPAPCWAAYSRVRTVVVPTATMRRDSARAWRIFAAAVFGDRIGLGMQRVLFDTLGAHGLEGSEADVEGDFCGLDAALAEAREESPE